jgi:predicted permease
LLASHTRLTDMVRHILGLPVIWSMVFAVALRLLHLELPVGIGTAVDMVGDAAIPMMLISLGLQLVHSTRIVWSRPLVTAVVMRGLVGPVVALVVGRLIGMSGLGLQSLVLAFAMPTAVNVFMQAREYESDADTVAAIVAISSLVGIVTISVVVTNLAMFV